MKIFDKAFNNIGGIVGENHGFIEQVTVEYDSETQKEYDATILIQKSETARSLFGNQTRIQTKDDTRDNVFRYFMCS